MGNRCRSHDSWLKFGQAILRHQHRDADEMVLTHAAFLKLCYSIVALLFREKSGQQVTHGFLAEFFLLRFWCLTLFPRFSRAIYLCQAVEA
jgi:hypothetical protein